MYGTDTKTAVKVITAVLAGAWRRTPSPPDVSPDELAGAVPLLIGSGAAPLGWHKVRNSPELKDTPPARQLQDVFRFQVLQSAISEGDIEQVFAGLRQAGVDAVLIKGWTVAQVYPEQGLRPLGDIDVCVRPAHFELAKRILSGPELGGFDVDLHEGFGESDSRPFDELYVRAGSRQLGATDVRVLSPEDHLHVLCVHMLRHGAWRPLWLCDVAAALENRPDDFDWERLLGRDRRRARWVTCALGLASQLLGARVEDTPVAREAARLPRWLVPEVLRQWETPFPLRQAPTRHRAPMSLYLRRPSGVVRDLLNRWPNPIAATIHMGGPFNEMPRLPFQFGECAARTVRFLLSLRKILRGRR